MFKVIGLAIVTVNCFVNSMNCIVLLAMDNTSLCIDYPVERCKITGFLVGSILPNLKGSLKRLK